METRISLQNTEEALRNKKIIHDHTSFLEIKGAKMLEIV